MSDVLERLDNAVAEEWARIHQGRFWTHLLEHGLTPDLYRSVMVELYHYTRHNSINQAVAAGATDPDNTAMLKYCYDHSNEELGHEKMVLRDIEAAGLKPLGPDDRHPLPPTRALISYLYEVAGREGAVSRLGYSYWAEGAYDHIGDLLTHMRSDLGLDDRKMTFFVAHQAVDVHHLERVRQAVDVHAVTPEQQQNVMQVARTTLWLTGQILEVVLERSLATARPNAAVA